MDLDAFLRAEVKPALGCTEPGAVALAAAHAARALGRPLDGADTRIRLGLSVNIYKNGRSVMLPRTGGLKGNRLAAALGAQAGNPDLGLTVLRDITPADVERARALVGAGAVEEAVVETTDGGESVPSVWIEVVVESGGHTALCRIAGRHDRVERVETDGRPVFVAAPVESGASGGAASPVADFQAELRTMDFAALWELAGQIGPETGAFLLEGARMNLDVADKGMREVWGMGVGASASDDESVLERIRHATGGASDVRMSGGDFPIMSSAGSGNHGITAIIPVAVVAQSLGASDRALAEALALSHLICGYLKAYTGRLTPICGCSVAAGAGAAGAMARLLGADAARAERAVVTLVAGLLGMICDGAKETCSLKVATAGCEAYSAARLAVRGGGVRDVQGMVAPGIAELGEILAEFSQRVLAPADGAMARIMLKHQTPAGV